MNLPFYFPFIFSYRTETCSNSEISNSASGGQSNFTTYPLISGYSSSVSILKMWCICRRYQRLYHMYDLLSVRHLLLIMSYYSLHSSNETIISFRFSYRTLSGFMIIHPTQTALFGILLNFLLPIHILQLCKSEEQIPRLPR